MTITFAQKLERMPHYEAGLHEDAAREAFGAEDIVKLASNESPWGPHPAVVEAIAEAATGLNRYPDQYSRRLRRRIAERFEVEPAQVAIGNGSCEILLAAAEALCEPGDEILFAWPSFSIYPHLAALTGATRDPRAARRGLCPRPRRDARGDHRGDPARLRQQPEQPDRHPPPGGADRRRSWSEVPHHVTVALDEAYIEFQTNDDPDATVDFLGGFPNVVLLRTFSKVYGLAGLRCGYALGSAKFRAAVDAVRQPFSVNELAQVGGRRGDPARRRRRRAGRADDRRARSSSRRGCASSASTRPARRPTSPGSPSATATRPR